MVILVQLIILERNTRNFEAVQAHAWADSELGVEEDVARAALEAWARRTDGRWPGPITLQLIVVDGDSHTGVVNARVRESGEVSQQLRRAALDAWRQYVEARQVFSVATVEL